MKVFHYTHLNNWSDIDKEGLKLQVDTKNKKWFILGIFALLESQPKKWIKNEDFPEVWKWFEMDFMKEIDEIGILLEIKTDHGKDQVFIFEWAYVEGYERRNKKTPTKYCHKTEEKAKKAYEDSKIPLKEYLRKEDELDYSIPEVVFTEDIARKKITVSDKQPLLEAWLKGKKETEDIINLLLKKVPELKKWEKKWEKSKVSLH